MYQALRILIALISIVFFTYLIVFAFNFLNIVFDVYGIYLIWFIALISFWCMLPEETGDIFYRVNGKGGNGIVNNTRLGNSSQLGDVNTDSFNSASYFAALNFDYLFS